MFSLIITFYSIKYDLNLVCISELPIKPNLIYCMQQKISTAIKEEHLFYCTFKIYIVDYNFKRGKENVS